MADRTITWTINARVAGAINGMKSLGDATKRAADNALDWADQNEQAINTLSRGFGAAGLAMTGFAVLAVKKFADFDQAMSNVASTGEDARGSIDALREAAIQAGADTAFSATEAAGAIEELAKAGLSADQILGGGLAGSLDLAAAGSLDVASAAGYTVTALTQFGLKGSDAAHVADLLAAGAGKAMGDVEDFGSALNQAGLVASQTGLTIEETTGTLAAFAQAGLLGSDAGTSFKTMLQRLSAPSGEAATLMEELGIHAYDASGQFVGMTEFAGQLTDALGDMTPAQRNAALAAIFGADAVRAAAVVYSEGESGIRNWISAVDDQGYAAEQAAIRMDNLKGDIEGLMGSLETALIGMGEGANGPLRSLVQAADDAVDSFNGLPDSVKQATTLIAGGGGLALLGVAGMGKLAIGVNDAVTAMRDLGIVSESARGKVGRVGAALGKAAGLTAGLWATAAALDAITNSADKTAAGVERTTSALLGMGGEDVNSLFSGLGADYEDLAGAMDLLLGGSFDAKMERFGSGLNKMLFGGQLADQVKDAEQQFIAMGQALAGLVQSGNADEAARIFEEISDAAVDQGYSVEELNGLMPAYQEALAGVANQQELAAQAQAGLAGEYESTTGAVNDQATALEELVDAQREAAGIALTERDAQRELERSIRDAQASLAENGATLDATTEKGYANAEALDDIASSTWDVIAAMQKNGADQKTLQGVMQTSRDRFLGVATAAGMSAEEANALADELGLIPAQVQTNIYANTGQAMTAIENLKAAYAGIKDRTVQITTAFKETGIRPPAGFYVPGNAEGGPIIGPGTGTSDSILRRLSNGEHVLTAREVEAMGGHGEVMKWRKAALSGAKSSFAAGGPVLPPSMPYSNPAPAALSSQRVDVSAVARLAPQDVRALGDYIVAAAGRVSVGTLAAADRSAANTRSTRGRSH